MINLIKTQNEQIFAIDYDNGVAWEVCNVGDELTNYKLTGHSYNDLIEQLECGNCLGETQVVTTLHRLYNT